MKRVSAVLAAMATVLAAVPSAAADTSPPKPVRDAGRFTQLAIPDGALGVTGLRANADPDRVVAATVVLSTDSIVGARQRAERVGARFDAVAAQRAVTASQSALTTTLRGMGVTVRSSVTNVLNAVNVRVKVSELEAVAKLAGVSQVHVARTIHQFNGTSDEYTGVPSVWEDLGFTGAGMTIGIIDDGIDYYHADFGGSGDPADYTDDDPTTIEPGTFPTAKVLGGYDFVGDDYDADGTGPATIPAPDADPLACGHHGTHVAGTSAGQGVLDTGATFTGPYDADTISSNDFLVAPGSAPEASIRMYKVFGCDGSVNDDVLLDAIEMAVTDGVDVINMSLGAPWGTADEPLALAVDAATAAGVMSVISAGNEGSSAYMVGGPGTANTALSVAAVDTSSTTLPGVAITGDVELNAQNSNLYDYDTNGSVTGVLVDVGLGCDPGDYVGTAGKIVLATRGVCDRVYRAVAATDAGALGVIFINNDPGYPPVEGDIPGATVPFVGVAGVDGGDFADGQTVTLNSAAPIPNPAYTNFASFTSSGPRQDSFAKPDISAPGVNILSASVGTGTEGLLLSGTSMASPHTAGIAVLVRQAHPSWDPIEVKGAMMSNADPTGVGDFDSVRGGAGMVDAGSAVGAKAFFMTNDGRNSLSYGFRQLTGVLTLSRSIKIVNTSNAAVTYDMSADLNTLELNLDVEFVPSTVTVPKNAARNVQVRITINDPENLPEVAFDDGGALESIHGLVYATPQTPGAGIGTLVTPLLYVPYGLSDIQAAGIGPNTRLEAPVSTVTDIKLVNSGIHYGTYDTYQWAITDPMDTWDTLVPDIRDVGVQSFPIGPADDLIVFAISTYDRIANQPTMEYDIPIDLDFDDIPDYWLVAVDYGLVTSGVPDGTMGAFLFNDDFSSILDVWAAFAPSNGSVIEVPLYAQNLPGSGFAFSVGGFSVVQNLPGDSTGTGYFDWQNPGVSNGDFDYMDPDDVVMLSVDVNTADAMNQGALGWLVVSVDDAAGPREADRVPVRARRVSRI